MTTSKACVYCIIPYIPNTDIDIVELSTVADACV